MDQDSLKPARMFCDSTIPENCNYELPPIILLHGMFSVHTTWNKVKNKIASETRRQVFAVDLRNHGQSEWSDVSSMEAMLLDLELFFSSRNIGEAILVGHSLGGKLAAAFTMKKPEKVVKLVTEESNLSPASETEKRLFLDVFKGLKKIRLLPKHLTEKEVLKMFQQMVETTFPQISPSFIKLVMVPFHKDGYGNFCFDFNVFALEKGLANETLYTFNTYQTVSTPALFVFGDKAFSKLNEDPMLSEFFPNSKILCLKNCGHLPHLEVHDEFAELVCSFINDSA